MTKNKSINTVYDEEFFSYTSSVSRPSAEVIVPLVINLFPGIQSVMDLGSAQGVWLKAWNEQGIEDFIGVDGDYVDPEALVIPRHCFHTQDLNMPVDLKRAFDMAMSLEVAEHLKPENSKRFVQSLCLHADLVLFSAAPPGQGGEHHINERSYDSWRTLFSEQGYSAYDCIRPRIAENEKVLFWYRYNTILYVKDDIASDLPSAVKDCRVADDAPIADLSPLLFRIRKEVIRCLPQRVQNVMAAYKAKLSTAFK